MVDVAPDRDACIDAMTEMRRVYVAGFSDTHDFPVVRRVVAAYRNRAPSTVPRDAFLNAIRILHSLEAHEIPGADWERFNDSPTDFLMRADDPTTDAIWAAIQKRQPARYRA